MAATQRDPGPGTVYTETVVHSAPEAFLAEAPYQLAIIDLDAGGRLTVRILAATEAERVRIGDRAEFAEFRNEIPYYRKAR
jgi:uncharacterized OB-fold protein